MSESISRRLDPAKAEGLSDLELMRELARIWADPAIRPKLRGSTHFVQERLMHFGRRGFLTARERQGIFRTLYAGSVPLYTRLCSYERREELDPSIGEPGSAVPDISTRT